MVHRVFYPEGRIEKLNGASTTHCAGQLPPTLFVHAEDDQPEDRCCRSKQSEGCNIEEHSVSERRVQESQPAQSCKHRQNAQKARQKGGSENQVAVQERLESEKCQSHCGAAVIHSEKQQSQCLQLLLTKHLQVLHTSQEKQRCDVKHPAEGLDDAAGEA